MPAHSQLQNSENSDPAIIASWPSKVKSPPSKGLEINVGKIILSKNLTENKPVPIMSKRTCICAPSTHAGSFKCQLHRTAITTTATTITTLATKSPLLVQGHSDSKTSHRRRPPVLLSRFCRSASCKDRND